MDVEVLNNGTTSSRVLIENNRLQFKLRHQADRSILKFPIVSVNNKNLSPGCVTYLPFKLFRLFPLSSLSTRWIRKTATR